MTRYHRIREVRLREGLSIKSVSILLGLTIIEARAAESPTNDMTLSELQQWARAMRVPVAELVADSPEVTGECIRLRAGLTKAMKFAQAIKQNALDAGRVPDQYTVSLVDHLVDLMPELQSTRPWKACGSPRSGDDLGRIMDVLAPSNVDHEVADVYRTY